MPIREVRSLDGSIVLSVSTDGPLASSLTVDGKPVVTQSAIELNLAGHKDLGAAEPAGQSYRSVNNTWDQQLRQHRNVRHHFNEIDLRFKDHGIRFDVIARAYNEGAAFRFALPSQSGMETFTVTCDATEFAFPVEARVGPERITPKAIWGVGG